MNCSVRLRNGNYYSTMHRFVCLPSSFLLLGTFLNRPGRYDLVVPCVRHLGEAGDAFLTGGKSVLLEGETGMKLTSDRLSSAKNVIVGSKYMKTRNS